VSQDPSSADGPALVAGELRGYRQFDLRDGGLFPLVHSSAGPWAGGIEHARCDAGGEHEPPAPGCRCGLYAWYLPGSATVALGPASAVVAARGRCVLGDRGFRAASARIEAVTLPVLVRMHPVAARRAREMLARRYPGVRVYGSVRRMLKEHPPHDVRSLGIQPPRDRSRGYRAAAALLWLGVVLLAYSFAVLPRAAVASTVTRWWPAFVVLAVAWQAGLVWLFLRMLGLQTTGQPGGGPAGHRPGGR